MVILQLFTYRKSSVYHMHAMLVMMMGYIHVHVYCVNMQVDRVRRMKGEVEGPSREESTLAEEGLEHTSADTISSKYDIAKSISLTENYCYCVCVPHRAKKKKRVQFMLYYKDGVMVVPSEHSSSSGMVEKEVNREEGERGEEGEVEGGSGEEVEESDHGEGEGDSDDEGSGVEEMLETGESEGEEVEEGESDVDPAEEFGSDLESEGDSKLEEEEEEEEGEKDGGVDHCYTADSEKAKVCSVCCESCRHNDDMVLTCSNNGMCVFVLICTVCRNYRN